MTNPTRLPVFAVLILILAGCGGPTAPSEYPEVAGTYTGTLTLSVSQGSDSVTVTGSMRLVVEQSGPHLIMGLGEQWNRKYGRRLDPGPPE